MPPCLLSPELHPMRVNAVRQSSFLFAAHLETLRAPRDVSDTSSRDKGAQMTPCIRRPCFACSILRREIQRGTRWISVLQVFRGPHVHIQGEKEKKYILIFSL